MTADVTYIVDLMRNGEKLLTPSESAKLRRRQYEPSDVNLVIVCFDDLRLSKIINASKFAAIKTPTGEWNETTLALPVALKRVAGDSCILSSFDPPWRFRLVIERTAVKVAVFNIKKEMKKFDLKLDSSSYTSIDEITD